MAKYVWALTREETVERICNIQEQNAKAWLAAVISSLSVGEARRTMVTLWALWHAKRKAVYENTFQSPLSTHNFVERFIADMDLSILRPEARPRTATSFPRWIPPSCDVSKINVGVALSKNLRRASAAAVARDEAGNFLGASAMMMLGITEPEIMEAMALREGMAVANDLSLRRVHMASDCANAVRSMAGAMMAAYDQIVKELKEDAAAFQLMEIVHEMMRRGKQTTALILRREAHSSARRGAMSGFSIRLFEHLVLGACTPPQEKKKALQSYGVPPLRVPVNVNDSSAVQAHVNRSY